MPEAESRESIPPTPSAGGVDYRNWDWLPHAATEIDAYLRRMLAEPSITAHDITARAKSITSFQEKCLKKGYTDPLRQVTDTVAVRIITYSVTDRLRVEELVSERFELVETSLPGEKKDSRRRGYDSRHFIIRGEREDNATGWIISGGYLQKYFETFGGLELQIRTVAAHAWAEFEHSRRYKSPAYDAISDHDRITIDQLFGAASDARRALDETFIAIDRLLANPASALDEEVCLEGEDPASGNKEPVRDAHDGGTSQESAPPITTGGLESFLARRYPEDDPGGPQGLDFALRLLHACGISSLTDLEAILRPVDSSHVRRLMGYDTNVTRVRRLDDDLLSRLGMKYVVSTRDIGAAANRGVQLEWRFDRLRGKTATGGYSTYRIEDTRYPNRFPSHAIPASRALREVARQVGNTIGAENVQLENVVGREGQLLPSARPRRVYLENEEVIWVASNLTRDACEQAIQMLLDRAPTLALRVTNDQGVAAASPLARPTGSAGTSRSTTP